MTILNKITISLLVIFAFCSAAAWSRPNADRLGICYVFNGKNLQTTTPCVVSTGSGAGAHYLALHLPNSKKIYIEENVNVDPSTFTLNEQPAKNFTRDGFWFETIKDNEQVDDPKSNIDCYQVKKSTISYCYRFSE